MDRKHLVIASVAASGAVLVGCCALIRSCVSRSRLKHRIISVRIISPYIQQAVQQAVSRRGFTIDVAAPCQYGDFGQLDWDAFLAGASAGRRVSCLYNRASLVRKGMLGHYLQKRAKKAGANAIPVLPPGLVVDLEDKADIDNLRKKLVDWPAPQRAAKGPAWVAKASNANRGERLFVAHTAEEVIAQVRPVALEEGVVEWVVQQYVSPPLLIHERKFHIRAHFLVSGCPCCGTTRAWLHRNHHIVLLASEPYASNVSAAGDRLAHLTNHCLQELHPDYDESRQILHFDELDLSLRRPGVAVLVLQRMAACLTEALAAASSLAAGFAPLPQCFELFGADFVLEDRGPEAPGVFLLEVNAGPDLGVFGERFQSKCVELCEDVLRTAVEPSLDNQSSSATFSPASSCKCREPVSGFDQELWSAAPRSASAAAELEGFKRRLSIAGQWAKAMHEDKGISVRGPQALAMAQT